MNYIQDFKMASISWQCKPSKTIVKCATQHLLLSAYVSDTTEDDNSVTVTTARNDVDHEQMTQGEDLTHDDTTTQPGLYK